MTPDGSTLSLVAIALVVLLTGVIGAYGVRFARTTNDFLVASRTVRPAWNAAAISGEYLSAASFLGVAGLIAGYGPDALWYPVGFTAGYLALQLFVAAPLRRSGAYTVPDFAEIRWGSKRLRALSTGLVLIIAWVYMVPLLHGAGLLLQKVTGLPRWVGVTVVAVVVTLNVVAGGMRSITLVQAMQYWFKLVAISLPVLIGLAVTRPGVTDLFTGDWADAGRGLGGGESAAEIYSLMLATFLGTMGLPHVLVRFYTNVDGGSARATTVRVIALLGVFYVFPTLAGVLMHQAMPPPAPGQADTLLLGMPVQVVGGVLGAVLAALVAAGAIAAFLSTSSGLVVAAAGVLSTDVLRGRVRDFRTSAVVAGLVPLLIALPTTSADISRVVGMAFAVAASTFCPLLVLGIWWRGLTTAGAFAGLIVGGGVSLGALVVRVVPGIPTGSLESLVGQPAVVSVPASFVTMVVVSLFTRTSVTPRADAMLAQLHLPSAARRIGAGR